MSTLTKKVHEVVATVKYWFELFPKTGSAISFIGTTFWIIVALWLAIACVLMTFWSGVGAYVMLAHACYEPNTIAIEALLIVSAVVFGYSTYLAVKRLYISRFC